MKTFGKIVLYTFLVILGIEIALQIYNPFTARVKNGEIIIPRNTVYKETLPPIPGLDTHLVHSKNSLGFRGEELNDTTRLKVICMGGSTTECFYLSDGKDWPSRLGTKMKALNPEIWMNNAGMDGQSSYGNLMMLKQYIVGLKPNYIILMCGLNDMSLDAPSRHDVYSQTWLKRAYNTLELPATIVNLLRAGKAKKAGLNHQYFTDLSKAETLNMSDTQIMKRMEEEVRFIGPYKQRLRDFARICKANNIQLILVGQAILFGKEKDLLTDVDLGKLKTGDMNGEARADILKMYNKSTYDMAQELGLPFINLTARMPKDSRYFYDGYHFTIDGADIVSDIILDEIKKENLIPLKRK